MTIESLLEKKYITSGEHTESVDGSGWNPSINESNVEKIFGYIKSQMDYVDWNQAKVLDVGTGLGYFTRHLNSLGIPCLGAEGAVELYEKGVDQNHTVIWDLSKEIDFEVEKIFDVSFSFEVVEHVAPHHQRTFWENVAKLSKYHFCSIHVENGVNEYHKCMMNLNAWVEYFNMMNFKIKNIIPRDTWIKEVVPWECSEFFILEF